MIIKSHRVRTRGGAKRKLLDHLMNGEGNEEVTLVCGTMRDIDDAFADARRLGREYALRHWIVAPSHAVADDELLSTVALLEREFNTGSRRPVIFRHWKEQTHAGGPGNTSDRHLHVLMPEVDPVTNSVLSNSNNFARHEKLSRMLEHAWGHPFTAGAHNAAVIKALRTEGNETLAAALEAAFPDAAERPRQAFEPRDHQRLKREGYDLPALRLMISEAWTTKVSQSDFTAKLADHNLSVKPGEKRQTFVIEAGDGTLVGALHRLVRLRKEAVFNYMEELRAEADDAFNRGSDLSQHPVHSTVTPADHKVGGTNAEPGSAKPAGNLLGRAASDTGGDPAATAGPGEDHQSLERAEHREGDPRNAEKLNPSHAVVIELALAPHRNRVAEMLAFANSVARSSVDRAAVELANIEEQARTAAALVKAGMPEPRQLLEARQAVQTASAAGYPLREQLDQIAGAITLLAEPRSWWGRTFDWLTGAAVQKQAEMETLVKTRRQVERALRHADEALTQSQRTLKLAETQYADAAREHRERWAREAASTAQRLEAAKAAADLWRVLPGLSNLGVDSMCRFGNEIAELRAPATRKRHRQGHNSGIPALRPR